MAREPEKSTRETGKAKSELTAGSTAGGTKETADATSGSAGTIEPLNAQHQNLKAILAKRSDAGADRTAIVKEFAALWLPHIAVEQEVMAPALRKAGIKEERFAAIAIQKDIINLLLADLLHGEGGEDGQAKLEALAKQFEAHVSTEDADMFAHVATAEKSSPGLNAEMKSRYEQMRYEQMKSRFANIDESIGEAMAMLAPRRLSVPTSSQRNRREYEMSRYSNDRDRDEHGRFMSDDDNGYSRGSRSSGRDRDEQGRFTSEGGSYSRGRYDDDDRRHSRGGQERDDDGRFMSEGGSQSRGRYDEDERYSGRSRGRERDDEGRFMSDNGSSRGRFQGDDEHYGPRSLGSMGRDRDDEGRFTRRAGSYEGRDGSYENRSRWFGDSEDHPESSRRGWDNSRQGQSGWYGDPEGHSEASRRGWEGRGNGASPRYEERSRRYDEMPSHSQSRYADDRDHRRNDDSERGAGGRGHGGWSGDPEGHSEASRRGWQNRR